MINSATVTVEGLGTTDQPYVLESNADWSTISNIPPNLDLDSTDDFDGDWFSIANRPIGLDDGDDDTTYSAGTGLILTGTVFEIDNSAITTDWSTISNIPPNLDLDSTDDFDGDWFSIANRPIGLDDGDDDTTYSAGTGLILTGTVFEIDNSAITTDWSTISNIPPNLDLDSTDDFDGDWFSIANRPIGLDDGDDDTTYSAGTGLILTGTVFEIDNSAITTDWSTISNIPPNLDLDSTDDFDGDWFSIANRPIGLDDGDDDTTYSAGTGLILTGTVFEIDNSAITTDWTTISNIPPNLDLDSTDDFDGDWFSIANRPIGLDDGDDDDQNSTQVLLSTSLDLDGNGTPETNVQEALEALLVTPSLPTTNSVQSISLG